MDLNACRGSLEVPLNTGPDAPPGVRLALAAAVLLAAVGAVQANQAPTAYSDDTHPQEWRIYHDAWNNRTTYLGDTASFNVRMHVPAAGRYTWTLPAMGGVRPDLPNPIATLFDSFEVHGPTGRLGDLARSNATQEVEADGVHDIAFHFTFRIRNLTPYEYTAILEASEAVLDAERTAWPAARISSFPGQVVGFIRFEQASSSAPTPPCEDTCAGLTGLVQRDFNLVFRLAGHPFSLHFHQAPEVSIEELSDAVVAIGSRYVANADFDAQVRVTGTGGPVQLLLDQPGTEPLATLDLGTTTVRLPAGEHRFLYRIDGPPASLTVSITSERSATQIQDEVMLEASRDGTWMLLLPLPLVLLLRRRRFIWNQHDARLYTVVDRRGRLPPRLHQGRPPPFALVRKATRL